MGDEIRALDLQGIEHVGHIVALRLLVIATLGARREPHPTQVGGDDRMVAGKLGRQGRPHIACFTVAVEHDHSWPLAADPDVEDHALRLDRLSAEPSRKRLHVLAISVQFRRELDNT